MTEGYDRYFNGIVDASIEALDSSPTTVLHLFFLLPCITADGDDDDNCFLLAAAEFAPSSTSPLLLVHGELSIKAYSAMRMVYIGYSSFASQTASVPQRLLADLATETAKYMFPKRFESRNLEEALMSVPDLETVKFKVLTRNDQYEIRELKPYFVVETTMPGKYGFYLNDASQSFNVLAEYLFGKVFNLSLQIVPS
ncbi:hypothetical protein L1887_30676 [Cichorium endivia]|nr:hypothetical protein L1887_30676 [Cichorium endivia]